MKFSSILFILISSLFLFSCGNDEEPVMDENNVDQTETFNSQPKAVEVIEVLEAGSYNYLNVNENGNEYWIAVPRMEIEEGEMIYFSKSMEMKNFKSESLERTFESVLFVDDARKTLSDKMQNTPHPDITNIQKENVEVDPLSGGVTIAKIFDQKNELSGKEVKLRGKVVKVNNNIMNRNWIHIQDGTGEKGEHDLVVTSKATASVGQTVIITGMLTKDKDYGAGYSYPVVIENAEIEVE